MSNQLNPVSRIAQIIEEAAAKSSGGFSTGIPTLSHLQAADQIVQEFGILDRMTMDELTAANSNPPSVSTAPHDADKWVCVTEEGAPWLFGTQEGMIRCAGPTDTIRPATAEEIEDFG